MLDEHLFQKFRSVVVREADVLHEALVQQLFNEFEAVILLKVYDGSCIGIVDQIIVKIVHPSPLQLGLEDLFGTESRLKDIIGQLVGYREAISGIFTQEAFLIRDSLVPPWYIQAVSK